MIYKQVEKIKEPISAIGIGCWNFGGDWDCSTTAILKKLFWSAIDQGINFFDIAPVYGFSHSETVLGSILKKTWSAQQGADCQQVRTALGRRPRDAQRFEQREYPVGD